MRSMSRPLTCEATPGHSKPMLTADAIMVGSAKLRLRMDQADGDERTLASQRSENREMMNQP
jgi:hypothetical protein